MIIGCPNCETKFALPDGVLGEKPRKVRCASCQHIWAASASDEIIELTKPAPAAPVVAPPAAPAAPPATPPAPPPPPPPPPPREDDAVVIGDEDEVSDFDTVDTEFNKDAISGEGSFDLASDDEASGFDIISGELVGGRQEEEEIKAPSKDIEEAYEEAAKDGIGSSSVDDALAAVRDETDDPENPLGKGVISEGRFRRLSGGNVGVTIAWAALAIFILGFIATFILARDSISTGWPASQRLYIALGLSVDDPTNPDAALDEYEDLSAYIRFSNEAEILEDPNGGFVLNVRGTITNSADFAIRLPRVYGTISNAQRQVIMDWYFDLPETNLQGQRTMPFETQVTGLTVVPTTFELFLLWDELRNQRSGTN